ncbi:hypothetical protein CNMCM5793_007728 [Aspergillus hiratsukae]|uniref:Uncharacterized protein n=1 Tax=Aspergillus hiratsukae TaxID=1194566 RepID=A0A8H6PQV4_9EURO|nr:hypothetical protein CNMCM5793_007728 [Aspergillus hiratsukae]KAF7159026.1 hypothetical protein CNMCM6106_006119 [Aspergillus hiratsukae]
MPSKLKSREEQLATMRALLHGETQLMSDRTGKYLKNNRAQNLLLGVGLHAATRKAKGLELSDLEQRSLDTLRIVTDDAGIAEFAREYVAAKKETRGTKKSILPDAILELDEETSFTQDDLRREAKKIIPHLLAQPNNQIVDMSTVEGGCVDTDEHAQAVAEAGGGVTVFMVPEPPRNPNDPKPSAGEAGEAMAAPEGNRYRLDLARFHSGSDGNTSSQVKTREYGKVETGSRVNFDSGTTLFDGRVLVDVAGHIEVWEADDSGGSFYHEMQRVLRNVANYCIDAATEAAKLGDDLGDEYGATGNAAAILGLAALVTGVMGVLVGLIINDDDFVARRTVGWTTAGLDWFLNTPSREISLIFDGGRVGKHELFIRRYMDERYVSPLSLTGFDGTDFPRVSVEEYRATLGAAMREFRGQTVAIYPAWERLFFNHNYQLAVAAVGSEKKVIFGAYALPMRPDAIEHNGRLHVAYIGSDNRVLIQSCSNIIDHDWTIPREVGRTTARSYDGPAIASFEGAIWAVHRGVNDHLYYSSSGNGEKWHPWCTTGIVHRAWRKKDTHWQGMWENLGINGISSGITATVFDGSIWIAAKRTPEGAIGVYVLGGKTFTIPGQYCVGTPTVFVQQGQPALCYSGFNFY